MFGLWNRVGERLRVPKESSLLLSFMKLGTIILPAE